MAEVVVFGVVAADVILRVQRIPFPCPRHSPIQVAAIPRGCLLAVARRRPVLVCVGGGCWFGRAGGWREGSPR